MERDCIGETTGTARRKCEQKTLLIKSKVCMTTQEIHQALEGRVGKKISYKHLCILLECFGQDVNDDNLESFLRYAWGVK